MLAGVVFVVGTGLQAATRQGFDIARHPISLLALGEHGWIERAIFIITGALAIAGANGLGRALARGRGTTWAPLLLAGYGAGDIIAGLFTADPGLGFPPGASESQPVMSWHGALHGIGFAIAMVSLLAACIVLARRFAARRERGWEAYSIATAVSIPVLIGVSTATPHAVGIPLVAIGVITSAWLVAIFGKALAEQPATTPFAHAAA